jgi:WD40 repeat protein
MRILTVLALLAFPLLLLGVATEPPAQPAGKPLKVEAPKEPAAGDTADLPAGALLRIGSSHTPRGLATPFAYSPDGKYVTAGTKSHHVRVWDVSTGKVVHTFGPFAPSGLSSQIIAKSAFSPDGKILAVAAGKFGHLFDLATGKELGKLEGHTHVLEDIAFSRDGGKIVTGAFDQTVAVWDATTFKRRHSFAGFANAVYAVAISPDGTLAAGADYKGALRVWKIDAGTPVHSLEELTSMATLLRFADDGKTLTAVSHVDGLLVWNIDDGKVARREKEMKGTAALSPDGTLLAAIGDAVHKPIHVWDLKANKLVATVAGNRIDTHAFAIAPGNATMATYGADGLLRFWKLPSGEEIRPPAGHQHRVSGVGFTRDGKQVISSSEDGTVRFWDAAAGKELRRLTGDGEYFHALALSPDGRTLALSGSTLPRGNGFLGARFGSEDVRQWSSLRFWDLDAGKEARAFHLNGEMPGWLRYTGDGKTILGLGWGGVRLFDTATGKERSVKPGRAEQGLPAADISADGRYVATSSNVPALRQIGKVAIFDLSENKEVFSKTFYLGGYSGLAFTPDGKSLAVAGSRDYRDKEKLTSPLQLWEVPTEKVVRHFEIDGGSPTGLTFSRDGRMLAALQGDKIEVFETATGKRRFTFAGHEGNVTALAFSRNGRRLVSGGEDCRLMIWDLTGATGPVGKQEPKDLDALWGGLASDDAQGAARSLGKLVAHPEEAVPYLRLRLTVLTDADLRRTEKLVADLDDPTFKARDAAARELERIGEAAVPVLKRALESKSAEVRQTAERLLKKIGDGEDPATSADALRLVRAVEVLERIGGADAVALLKDLRRRGGKLIPIREADAALKRLEGE